MTNTPEFFVIVVGMMAVDDDAAAAGEPVDLGNEDREVRLENTSKMSSSVRLSSPVMPPENICEASKRRKALPETGDYTVYRKHDRR